MQIEQIAVDLSTNLDPAQPHTDFVAQISAQIQDTTPCAELSEVTMTSLRIDFGPTQAPCTIGGLEVSGALRVEYSLPGPDVPVVTLTYLGTTIASVTLAGSTQVTWGRDDTQRIISELRIDTADSRQIEVQADRIQRDYRGALQVDGWRRWQTLLGNWGIEHGNWEQGRGALLPARGVATIETPYQHHVFVDFRGEGPEGFELRINGGRTDRIYVIADNGEIVDKGDD